MNKFIRRYTVSFFIWLAVLIASVVMLPNVSQLITDKGETKIPSSAQSQVADTIQSHWGHKIGNTRQVVVVFNNGDKKITSSQQAAIDRTIADFESDKKDFDIKKVTSPNQNAITKKQLISKDKTTELVQLDVGKRDSVDKMNKDITKAAKTNGVKTYVTGSDILNDDFRIVTEQGLKKTELITVVFILIVLIIVFRSLIVPFISLLSVGVSFLVSQSIVMNLVDKYNFPISNFTQIFMVVVLFGIGTDYNILLFNEFKNQLSQGKDKVEATIAARKTAGRTILYSGTSLLIGFSALGLAKFSIYRSAVGVAVGVAVLLLVLLTLNPFFMSTLGQRIFWPSKSLKGESNSRTWTFLSKHSVAHPIIALLIALVATVPFVLNYNSQLDYDNVVELNSGISAKKGFEVVQDHFSKGTAEPTTIYIKADHKLDNEKDLKEIDRITKQVQQEKGIDSVNTVTQPGGVPLKQLYLSDQLSTLTGNVNTMQKGLKKVSKGMKNSDFNTTPLSDIGSSTQSIASQLTAIQQSYQAAGTSATPTQMVGQLNQQLSAGGQGLNSIQQSALTSAVTQVAAKQQQTASTMQSSLQGVASDTKSIGTNAKLLQTELEQMQTKLMAAGNGIDTVNDGLGQTNQYLKGVQKSAAADTFYIPNNVLKSKTFKTSTDTYMSSDKKAVKMIVVLKTDPSTETSMNRASSLKQVVKDNLKGTDMKNATVAVGGQTSNLNDTKNIATSDFLRTAIIMIVGITFALMLISHSLLQPVYVMVMLLLTYFTSLGLTELISGKVLHQDTLTWNTPFFTFIMLIALGVDYSIFLIMQYHNNPDHTLFPSQRIIQAAGIIGSVVISAVVILGGTFAALMPSGVMTLIQVAVGVILGLVILVIAIPIVFPALIKLTYEPFHLPWSKSAKTNSGDQTRTARSSK
ncbi:MMPL family transporter [Lentilactobacillus senioris]|uniref:MMPL family transporter n=1 Tax=Lentilactobacillus senioris TaxID=931534 RepID=UPI002280D874|nr:MMPL family transporter [Lentilactobacillus senioris]MCY9806408.1 MMPL family transporter [Lentilactobacillus senioris]